MVTTRAPESLNWRTPMTFRECIMRAVSLPFFVGAALFVLALIAAAWMVLSQPHTPIHEAASDAPIAGSDSAGETADPSATHGVEANGNESDPTTTVGVPGEDVSPTVFVHVIGEVNDPGVVQLSEGARVEQAIAEAGGATETAVLAGVNLARRVVDGEQILIPNAADIETGLVSTGDVPTPGVHADGIVDIGVADSITLQSLPGIGPVLAQRIIEWRTAHGGFTSVEQLREVPGIGVRIFEELRKRIRV